MKIGELIRNLRNEKSLTQAALADLAGITQQYLCDIELGKRIPTSDVIDRISDHIGQRFEMYRLVNRMPADNQVEFLLHLNKHFNKGG